MVYFILNSSSFYSDVKRVITVITTTVRCRHPWLEYKHTLTLTRASSLNKPPYVLIIKIVILSITQAVVCLTLRFQVFPTWVKINMGVSAVITALH